VLDLLGKISSQQYHGGIFSALKQQDRQVYEFIVKEYERQQNTLQLIAAENLCSQAVLAALGSIVQNKTTEGFPGARYHGGCEVVDEIETLAAERAKEAFGAQYANVQPHSGTSANQIVLTALLERGDKILSLGLDQGGHVSHGANVSFSGKFFEVENYCVDRDTFLLDYDAVSSRAKAVRPKLIICGATAYSRTIDFKKFREIADSIGAFLLADISHIAGLVIAGAHPSPVNHAHFTTTSTYKPGGPRGGLILMGRDFDRTINIAGKEKLLWRHIDKTTFPGIQGTPYLNNIAAKAIFFKESLTEEYKKRQFKIIENAERLANNLVDAGYDVLTGGTDNHMILVNVSHLRPGLTGFIAQKCLEDCGIIINMNRLPYDQNSIGLTSGIRLGTPIVTKKGMGTMEMDRISVLIDSVLKSVKVVSGREYEVKKSFRDNIKNKVLQLCDRFPGYKKAAGLSNETSSAETIKEYSI
jgi:glycine hydroxymethyltransferase